MAFRTIGVPGFGDVDFPDSMTDDQVVEAIERDIMPQVRQSTIAPPAGLAARIDLSRRAPLPGEVSDDQAALVRSTAPVQGNSPALAERMTQDAMDRRAPSLEDHAARIAAGQRTVKFTPPDQYRPEEFQGEGYLANDPSLRGGMKGFFQAATAGTYQPEVTPEEQRGAAVGAVPGSLVGGVATGLMGPVGPAAFSFLSFSNELKRRGMPVERMTEPEIMALAAASGVMTGAIPANLGGGLFQRAAGGAFLGAGQNLIEEEVLAGITDTPAERLPAAILGGAFGAGFGAMLKNSPRVQQAVKARLAPQQWDAIASQLIPQGPARPEVSDAEFTPVQGAPDARHAPAAQGPAIPGPAVRAPAPAVPPDPAAGPGRPEGRPQQDAGYAPDEAVQAGPEQRVDAAGREAYVAALRAAGMTDEQIAAGMRVVDGAPIRNLFDRVEMRTRGEEPPAAPPEPPARPRLGLSHARFVEAKKYLTKGEGREAIVPTDPEVVAFLQELGDQPVPAKVKRAGPSTSLAARMERTQEIRSTDEALRAGGAGYGVETVPIAAKDLGPRFEVMGMELRRVKTRDPAVIRYKDAKGKTYDFQPEEMIHTGGQLPEARESVLKQDGPEEDLFLFQTAEMAGVPARYTEDAQVIRRARELWEAQGTESPFFRRWFGGSKVVSPEGKPKVVYHGTPRPSFDTFDTWGRFGLFGHGTYFTENPRIAGNYADNQKIEGWADRAPGVYPVYLALKNPMDMEAPARVREWKEQLRKHGMDEETINGMEWGQILTNEDAYKAVSNALVYGQHDPYDGAEMLRTIIEGMDHDGITHIGGNRHARSDGTQHRVWVAFNPEQIKSATGNRGTFHEKNPNILMQRGTPKASQEDMFGNRGRVASQGFIKAKQGDKGEAGLPLFEEPGREAQARADEQQQTLLQDGLPQDVKGSFHMEGQKAVITLFKGKADFSTWMHEHAHVLRRAALSGADETTVVRWLEGQGIKVLEEGGAWSREAEERFARGFERYLRDGQAPSEGLRAAFEKIAKFMREVYQTIRGTELEGAIPENVRWVYDRLVGGRQGEPGKDGPPTLFQAGATPPKDKVGPAARPPYVPPKEGLGDAISYDAKKGSPASGYITPAEKLYTDAVNEAFPIEKIQAIYEREQGRKLSPTESIKYAINRVLGSGGSANLHLEKNLKPIYQGGATPDGYVYPKLTPNEARLLDEYVIARDTLWRYDNQAEKFDNPAIPRERAVAILEKHKQRPALVQAKIEHAADGLVRYSKDLAARKVKAGIWTQEQHDIFTRNPYYVPEIRDFDKVTSRPVGKKKRAQFSSTNNLIRGTKAVDLDAPVFDPLSALISDTHAFAAEGAKMAVWNKVIDLAETSPELDGWIKRLPAEYQPQPHEGTVQVLRNRQTHLTDPQREFAEKYKKAQETLKNADKHDRDEGTRRYLIERIRDRVYRNKGKTREAAEEIEEIIRKEQASYMAGLEKRREAAEKTVEEFKKLPKAERNLIQDWIDEGMPQTYLVPKEIAEAVAGMTPVEWAFWQKPMVAAASLFRRFQVGYNPDFTLSNLPRDMQEAYFNVGLKPWYALKGLYHYVKKDAVYEAFLRHGGSMEGDESGMKSATDMGSEIRYGQGLVKNRYAKVKDPVPWENLKTVVGGKEISYGQLARGAEVIKQTVTIPLEMAEAFGQAGEMMTRLGVMDMAMNKKKLSPAEAADLARGATLDFKRIGAKMKTANAMVPFLNARIQGMDRMLRTAKQDPAGAAVRFLMWTAGPAAALLAWNSQNENYKDIPAWEKQYYWILMTSRDGKGYLKVAKGHLAQLIVNPIQMTMENRIGTAKKDWWKIAADVLKSGLPVDDVGSTINPLAKLPLELMANYDFFFDRDIVKDPGRPAGYQYDQGTAETMKTIGRALGVSPAQMQHVAKGLLGGSATNLLWALDFALGKTGAQPEKKLDIGYTPFLKRMAGVTQDWKSDLEQRGRTIRKELKEKEAAYGKDFEGNLDPAYGSYKIQIRKAKDEGREDEETARAKRELDDLEKEIRALQEELKAVHKGMKANEQLRKDLQSKAADSN